MITEQKDLLCIRCCRVGKFDGQRCGYCGFNIKISLQVLIQQQAGCSCQRCWDWPVRSGYLVDKSIDAMLIILRLLR